MRSLMFLPVLMLFCSLQDTSYALDAIDSANSVCCGGFTDMKIPVKKIVSYHWTSSTCALKAIVFYTVAGKVICVDPDNSLVRSHVSKLEKRTSSNTKATPESALTSSSASTSAKTTSPESASTTEETPASTSATASSPKFTSPKTSSPESTSATSSPESTSTTAVTFTTAESHSTTV